MELEEQTEAVCPLCNDEIVEIKLNSSEKEAPYFTCRKLQATVPGMYGAETEDFVKEHIELAQAREDDESDESEDTRTLAQILGGEDDE